MSLLSDTLVSTSEALPPTATPKFCMYGSPHHQITKSRYITSNDPRGYIPVYEYPLNGQWIMMDSDDGYVLWTGIWKALGNNKADIVKMLDTQPELGPLLRRVRGGFLKIQGTWMPYEVALRLSRRVAWTIRNDLVPLFGPTFPSTCLTPDQPGFGQLCPTGPASKRKSRRSYNPIPLGGAQSFLEPTSPLPISTPTFTATPSYDRLSTSAPTPSYFPPVRTTRPNNGRYSPYDHRESRLSLPLPATKDIPPFSRSFDHTPESPNSPSNRRQPIALPPISAMDKYTPSECSADILQRLKHNNDAFPSISAPLPNRNCGAASPLSSSCSTAPSLVTGDSDSRYGSPTLPCTPSSLSPQSVPAITKAQPIFFTGSLPPNRNWFSGTASSSF